MSCLLFTSEFSVNVPANTALPLFLTSNSTEPEPCRDNRKPVPGFAKAHDSLASLFVTENFVLPAPDISNIVRGATVIDGSFARIGTFVTSVFGISATTSAPIAIAPGAVAAAPVPSLFKSPPIAIPPRALVTFAARPSAMASIEAKSVAAFRPNDVEPIPVADALAPTDVVSIITADAVSPNAVEANPAAEAERPTAVELPPTAIELLPNAVSAVIVAEASRPIAVVLFPPAEALAPTAVVSIAAADAVSPSAVEEAPAAEALAPTAMEELAAEEFLPTAVDNPPDAELFEPRAVDWEPKAVAELPIAVFPNVPAFALAAFPITTEASPEADEFEPIAVENAPFALADDPHANRPSSPLELALAVLSPVPLLSVSKKQSSAKALFKHTMVNAQKIAL